MSVTSLRSVRSITPIESPDDQSFFDAVVQGRPHSGSNVRVDNLFGENELHKPPDGKGEFKEREVEVRELDKQEKVEGLQNLNSKNVVQVKSNIGDDFEDIYDFDYVKVNQNSEKGHDSEKGHISEEGHSSENQQNGEYGGYVSRESTENFPEKNYTHRVYRNENVKKVDKDELSLEEEARKEDVDKKHQDGKVLERAQEYDVISESVEKTKVKNVFKVKSISVHSGPRLEDILSDEHTLSRDSQKDENQDFDIDIEDMSKKRTDERRKSQTSAGHKEDDQQTYTQEEKQNSESYYISHPIGNTNLGNDGILDVKRDKSENNAIEFDDSVENSYFAMFKKSENNETEDKENRQHTGGSTETGSGENVETIKGVNSNQALRGANVNGNIDGQSTVDIIDIDGNVEIGFDKNADDGDREKKVDLNDNDTKEHQEDAGQPENLQNMEIAKQSEETMPKVTEESKSVTENENSERTNNIDYEHDKYNDKDSNDGDEPGRKASARTLRSNASTNAKSAHRVSGPPKTIEEMNALERLKHTPYTEHLAKGYSKHASSSSVSHPKQQNPKQKRQRQQKPGADHTGGGEMKQVDHRGKTDEGATQKKEPTSRMGSGTKPGMEKKNQAPKEKKKFFRRKEKKPSATVARPIKIMNDENMNEVKDVKETPGDAEESQIPVVNAHDDLPPEKQEVVEQTLESTVEVPAQVVLIDSSPLLTKAELPDKTDGILITDPGEIEKSHESTESADGDSAIDEKTPKAITTTAEDTVVDNELKNEDEGKREAGKNSAETSGKGTPKSKKQKEAVKAKTNGDNQKGPGPRTWFGGKKKQNQGDNSSLKNKTRPKSSLPVNGIIITTSSEDSPKSEESKLTTDAIPAPEVPAALTIVDETNSEPHGKAGRVVLANIKQKLLKDSSMSGSLGSAPAHPLSQRSRSPSPETSFSSSSGSRLARVAHKTQSMSSLQVPGAALATPRDHGQDDDNVSITSRRDSTSRRSVDYRSIQDATAAMAPDAADEKPKSVLTNDETFIKNAIPYLPLSLAIVCLLLNIVLPGSGTALSGLSILCCGQARVSNKNDQILTTLCANCLVGLAQLFTVTFLLVGWFWSIGWGIQMVSLSVQHREEVKKQRAKELQALALSAFGSPKRGVPFGP